MSEIMIAGFGGQGILAAGVMLANAGLLAGLQTTWLPSYGATMRGGTANCFVKIDSEEIGSPYVDEADFLLAFNEPSLLKFHGTVKKGGCIFANSSLIRKEVPRSDVNVFYVPATERARELGDVRTANVFMLGVLFSKTALLPYESAAASLEDYFSAKSEKVIELNKRVFRAGYEWKEG